MRTTNTSDKVTMLMKLVKQMKKINQKFNEAVNSKTTISI